jgi:hypothetical protein
LSFLAFVGSQDGWVCPCGGVRGLGCALALLLLVFAWFSPKNREPSS